MNENHEVIPEGVKALDAVGLGGTDDPSETPEPDPPKAWQVEYSGIGSISVVGTSQKSVAGMVIHLRSKFKDLPWELVPIKVLNLGGQAETIWIVPANLTGVFNQTPARSHPQTMAEAFPEMMKRQGMEPKEEGAEALVVIAVDPTEGDDDK